MPMDEWTHLNFTLINTTRQITLNKNLSVGGNILTNTFYLLNNTIPLEWVNKSLESFKIHR
jgi:hypothetical protein